MSAPPGRSIGGGKSAIRTLSSFVPSFGHDPGFGLARAMRINESNEHRDRMSLDIVYDAAYDQRGIKQELEWARCPMLLA